MGEWGNEENVPILNSHLSILKNRPLTIEQKNKLFADR